MSIAWTVFVVAVLLYIAARLIVAVLPVLVVVGVIVFLGFAGWSFYRFRQSRW